FRAAGVDAGLAADLVGAMRSTSPPSPWPATPARNGRWPAVGKTRMRAGAASLPSGEPAMQHPAFATAGWAIRPGTLALTGFHHVIVAAHVVAIPPAAFQAFGAGEDACWCLAQRHRARQQPDRPGFGALPGVAVC